MTAPDPRDLTPRSRPDAPDLDELVGLSRALGEPARRLALLAEGNTSRRLPGDRLAVKATGRSLRHASREDFVVVDLPRLSALVDDPAAGDAEVARYFDDVEAEQGARPSVETLLHVVCVLDAGATWVAHTHPDPVLGVLCSDRAAALAKQPLFPDQVVVVGRRPLLVPYVDPGVVLARHVRSALAAHTAEHGAPQAVYLRNHGMAALGASAAQTLQVTEMADKAARVMLSALAVGTLVPLSPADAARIDTRADEQVRRAALAGRGLGPPTPEEQP